MNISLLCPTRARPKMCFGLIKSALETAKDPSKLEFVFYQDEDDYESDNFFENNIYYLEDDFDFFDVDKQVKRIVGERIILSEMWNKCWEVASSDIFFHCGDDIRFRTKYWDEIIMAGFSTIEDRIAFIYGYDGYICKSMNFGTHGFLHRNWTDAVGYFVPPYFSSDYNDTWLNDVSFMIKRKYRAEIYTEHLHPAAGKYYVDQTHKDRLERHEKDNVKDLYDSEEMKSIRQEWANKLQNFIDNYK